jgi:hypothetical protein
MVIVKLINNHLNNVYYNILTNYLIARPLARLAICATIERLPGNVSSGCSGAAGCGIGSGSGWGSGSTISGSAGTSEATGSSMGSVSGT